MQNTYIYPFELLPSKEILNYQTDSQLAKNFAQTVKNTYELNDQQAYDIYKTCVGTGAFETNDWIPGRPVDINNERVIYIKFKDSHTLHAMPQ